MTADHPPPSRRTTSTDLGLADEGVRRIEWAEREMPVLRLIRERFERERPLEGLRIGACLHVTTETANLDADAQGRRRGGRPGASNPLSTQGRRRRRARRGVRDLRATPAAARTATPTTRTSTPSPTPTRSSPWTTAATSCRCSTRSARASSPRSWPGPRRRPPASSASGRWPPTARSRFPVVAVNEAQTKHLFDNRYGTGQSTVDGILRATNLLHRRPERGRRRLRLGGQGDRHRG